MATLTQENILKIKHDIGSEFDGFSQINNDSLEDLCALALWALEAKYILEQIENLCKLPQQLPPSHRLASLNWSYYQANKTLSKFPKGGE